MSIRKFLESLSQVAPQPIYPPEPFNYAAQIPPESDLIKRLKAEALEQLPGALVAQEVNLANFIKDWEAEKAAWSFRCERFGDFLSVCITHLEYTIWLNPERTAQKTALMVNMMKSSKVTLKEGAAPGREGVGYFTVCNGGYNQKGEGLKVGPSLDGKPLSYGWQNGQGGYEYEATNRSLRPIKIPTFATRAVNDMITFEQDPKVQIPVPATLGQSVMNAILLACREGYTPNV